MSTELNITSNWKPGWTGVFPLQPSRSARPLPALLGPSLLACRGWQRLPRRAPVQPKAVKRGQKIAVIEAMKMENDILAESDGTVSAIYVKKTDSVLEGADIASIA